jgi:DNA-binding beta-propeller fold protein YncE
MVYANIEDTSEVVEIDSVRGVLTRRFSIKPGEEPTGIAIDTVNGYVFSGCRNKMMTVIDIKSGKLIATIPVGAGVDGCGFDPDKKLAFAANGQDGTMSVIKETAKGKFEVIQTVETKKGARTMTVDAATHKIYLPTADFGPAPEKKPGEKWSRPPVIKGSFVVLVVGEK